MWSFPRVWYQWHSTSCEEQSTYMCFNAIFMIMSTGCSKCEVSAGHGVIQYKTGCSKCEIWWCSKCEVRSRHRSCFIFSKLCSKCMSVTINLKKYGSTINPTVQPYQYGTMFVPRNQAMTKPPQTTNFLGISFRMPWCCRTVLAKETAKLIYECWYW